jgi:predicted house-cleaning noncanonical NTP pyrophosphatase (MazG superfamily)
MEKLVRDRIAEFALKQRGDVLVTRKASEEELLSLLKNKLVEEANEVLNANSIEELIEEMADVLEVMKAISVKQNITDEIFEKREAKFLERGGFDDGIVLIK